ncbi:hypothetical protein EYF80_035458 [Liparis tanakae]|uniref:Uncharacterized protein n=1 Tax=Liparis tanakae TaxID=230148 RepID=A0A4Z2GL29_9TELE|nr:hypothetical protein EYF80_035458 [Liparis tanakae]
MELQSAAASGLPGPLSPNLDYALSPMSGGPSHGTSPNLSPGFSSQAAFNYNQLEGRFKQLQAHQCFMSFCRASVIAPIASFLLFPPSVHPLSGIKGKSGPDRSHTKDERRSAPPQPGGGEESGSLHSSDIIPSSHI